jgi:hypothetical protein
MLPEDKIEQHMSKISKVKAQYDNKFHMYDMELEYRKLIDGDISTTYERDGQSVLDSPRRQSPRIHSPIKRA